MQAELSRDQPTVVAWRVDNFADRFKYSIPRDEWLSDPYALEHPDLGSVAFDLKFRPRNGLSAESRALAVQITDERPEIAMDLECKAWLETSDGRRSGLKTEKWHFNGNRLGGFGTFLTPDELDVFRSSSVVFICVGFPFKVGKVGTPSSDPPAFHRWTIADFATRSQAAALKTEWTSDQFVVHGLGDVKFATSFYPKGDRDASKDHCGLHLKLVDLAGRPAVPVQYELWMESHGGERTHIFAFNCTYKEATKHGRPWYMTQLTLNNFASNGPFSVCSNVRPIVPPDQSAPSVPLQPSQSAQFVPFLRQMAQMFNVDEVSDLEVRGSESAVKVSKLVLFAHSPVFRSMITQPTGDRETELIEIKDVDDSVLAAMLRFLYTGEVDELNEIAPRLLPVADRFKLQPLVTMCTDSIIEHLAVAHALRDLKLAVQFDFLTAFKERVINFAHEHCAAIMELTEWNPFVVENPLIVATLLKISHS